MPVSYQVLTASRTKKAAYEPMVTIAEFDTVQAMLNVKNTRTQKEPKPFAFRGIIFCGECGCSITAETKTKRFKNGVSRQYTYYHCTRKRPCSQRSGVREEELQAQFSDTLKKYTILPQFKDWALEVLESQNEIESTDITAVLETQSRTIGASHKEMKRLIVRLPLNWTHRLF